MPGRHPRTRRPANLTGHRRESSAEAALSPAAGRDSVMLGLIRLCLSRTHAAPPEPESPAGRRRGGARAPGGPSRRDIPRRTIEMPLPQVNDRLKEIPAQALRTLFATIGQLILVADRFRARAAEQLSGSDESTATRPAWIGLRPSAPPPPARPAGQAQARLSRPGRDRGSPRGGGHWTRRGTSGCWTGAKNRTTRTCPELVRPFLNRLLLRCRPPSTRQRKLSRPSLSPPSPSRPCSRKPSPPRPRSPPSSLSQPEPAMQQEARASTMQQEAEPAQSATTASPSPAPSPTTTSSRCRRCGPGCGGWTPARSRRCSTTRTSTRAARP